VGRAKRATEVHIATLMDSVDDEGKFLGSMTVDSGDGPWMTEVEIATATLCGKLTQVQM